MTSTTPTLELAGLLTDLLHTAHADPVLGSTAGIVLHTTRGHLGAEPGLTDLLVGTSTTGYTVGHAHIGADGRLPGGPVLVPAADIKAAVGVLKAQADGSKEHRTRLTLEHRGLTMAGISEQPMLLGPDETDGATLTIPASELEDTDWPAAAVATVLTTVGHSQEPALPRTDLSATSVAPYAKIASRRREPLRWYRWHQDAPIGVQIGHQYRGAIIPLKGYSADDGHLPDAELHLPVPAARAA